MGMHIQLYVTIWRTLFIWFDIQEDKKINFSISILRKMPANLGKFLGVGDFCYHFLSMFIFVQIQCKKWITETWYVSHFSLVS